MDQKNCTHRAHNFQNMTGQVFGRLTVVRLFEVRKCQTMWWCRCECSTEKAIDGKSLRKGVTVSCGCRMREVGHELATHGESHKSVTAEYRAWQGMITRCSNPKDKAYRYYGAKGVKVCERWRSSFENFLADVGRRPGKEYSLDRINTHGNYEPGNVRWATKKQQMRNRRRHHMLTFNGETRCLNEWAEVLGMSRALIEARLRILGWSVEQALTTPKRGS